MADLLRALLGRGYLIPEIPLFFTKGKPTERIWYYDLADIKVRKKTPLTLDKF